MHLLELHLDIDKQARSNQSQPRDWNILCYLTNHSTSIDIFCAP
jgi:hypothetical protein